MSRALRNYELHHALRQLRGAAGNMSRAKTRFGRDALLSARVSMSLVRLHREIGELCALLDTAQSTARKQQPKRRAA